MGTEGDLPDLGTFTNFAVAAGLRGLHSCPGTGVGARGTLPGAGGGRRLLGPEVINEQSRVRACVRACMAFQCLMCAARQGLSSGARPAGCSVEWCEANVLMSNPGTKSID